MELATIGIVLHGSAITIACIVAFMVAELLYIEFKEARRLKQWPSTLLVSFMMISASYALWGIAQWIKS